MQPELAGPGLSTAPLRTSSTGFCALKAPVSRLTRDRIGYEAASGAILKTLPIGPWVGPSGTLSVLRAFTQWIEGQNG